MAVPREVLPPGFCLSETRRDRPPKGSLLAIAAFASFANTTAVHGFRMAPCGTKRH